MKVSGSAGRCGFLQCDRIKSSLLNPQGRLLVRHGINLVGFYMVLPCFYLMSWGKGFFLGGLPKSCNSGYIIYVFLMIREFQIHCFQVIRDYTPDPAASWRNGKPDYLLVPWSNQD